MSDENKGDNVTPNQDGNATETEVQAAVNDGEKQTVQYDTYRRVLSKLKNTESEFEKLYERMQTMEQDKLEAEGNKDQLIESLRKEVMETKTKLKTTVGSVARSQAMNAIVEEAVKAGCNSPDVVKKFLEDQIQNLEFDTDFNPDREQVKALVDEAKTSAPVLFSKEAPKVANHNFRPGNADSAPQKNLNKMSMDELMNTWAQAEQK